jgi:hypothetical protein
MIITLDLTWMTTFLPFLLIGFGFGISFYYIFYCDNSITELERKKHNLAVRKEWFKMLSEQKKELKWPADWSK